MPLIGPPGVTVSLAANATAGTFNGDLSVEVILSGMELFIGSRNGRKGDGQILTSYTQTETGANFTIAEPFSASAITNQPFVIDNFAVSSVEAARNALGLSNLLNALRKFFGLSTTLDQASKTFQRDRGQGDATFFQDIWSRAGRNWFGAEHRTIGGERWLLRTYADGTTPIDSVDIDGTTGGVDVRAAETSVTAAATTDLGLVRSKRVLINGSTTITSFGASPNRFRIIRFGGALVLTHNSSLGLPRAQNITTSAGDTAIAASDASGNWFIVDYTRYNGRPLLPPLAIQSTGGDEAALSTSAGFRLQTEFNATGPVAALTAICGFEASTAGLACLFVVEVYNIGTGAVVATFGPVRLNHTGSGIQNLALPFVLTGLNPGTTYRVWLKPYLGASATAYPRQMSIAGTLP